MRTGFTDKAKTTRYRTGFTLTEVVGVLATIAVLAGVLGPVMATVKRRSRLTTCASNLHQLHLARAMYATDHNGLLPPYISRAMEVYTGAPDGKRITVEQSRDLLAALHPYLRDTTVWRCPADTTRYNPREQQGGLPVPHVTSYWYEGFRYTYTGLQGLAMDTPNVMTVSTHWLLRDDASCPDTPAYDAYNHGPSLNLVYLDGHVKAATLECARPNYMTWH